MFSHCGGTDHHRNFLFATFFSIFVDVQSLVKLQQKEHIDIVSAETAIRETFNTLFTSLKIKDVQNKSRLKEFSTIHNFFVSIALKDYDNLEEIELLTRVNNVDNDANFITQINEALDQNYDSEILAENNYGKTNVEKFIKKIRYLKDKYNLTKVQSKLKLNPQITQYFNSDELLKNATKYTSNNSPVDNNVLHNRRIMEQEGRRVYRGNSVYDIKKFPFMASVHFFNKYRCGGCIISRGLIITSSTCLQLVLKKGDLTYSSPEILSFVSVRVGSIYTSSDGKIYGVRGIYFHPNYNPRTLENNIGVIRLSQLITFSRKITSVTLDFLGTPTNINDRVTVIGWGSRDSSNLKSRKLSYSKLDYYPLRYCKRVYSEKYVKDYYFCAGFVHKKGGACNYDMGGPGIVDDELAGIINFGPLTCGKRDSPTVFTKVAYYSDWIRGFMDPGMMDDTPIISGYPETIEANPDFARMQAVEPKTLREHAKGNGLISLLNTFKDFVSMIFAGTAS